MQKVYSKLYQSVATGGSVAIILRDWMEGQTRVFLSENCIRDMSAAGFSLTEWHKWKPTGSAQQKINLAAGTQVVFDEDILIFCKP